MLPDRSVGLNGSVQHPVASRLRRTVDERRWYDPRSVECVAWPERPARRRRSGIDERRVFVAVAAIPAYLLGTFPTAMLVARAGGHDVLTEGSGNPGASNVARLMGWKAGCS